MYLLQNLNEFSIPGLTFSQSIDLGSIVPINLKKNTPVLILTSLNPATLSASGILEFPQSSNY